MPQPPGSSILQEVQRLGTTHVHARKIIKKVNERVRAQMRYTEGLHHDTRPSNKTLVSIMA